MPDVFTLSAEFRAALLRRERKAAIQIAKAYGKAWRAIRQDIEKLTKQITAMRARGDDVPQSWLLRERRLEKLTAQIKVEMDKFSEIADAEIQQTQRKAIASALDESVELMRSAIGAVPPEINLAFTKLPTAAFESLVGTMQNGAPLRVALDKISPQVSAAVADALTSGLARGLGIQRIARDIRNAGGIGLKRALRISRTEILRAYRIASTDTYKANNDIVKGWIWTSGLGRRTCASCWALHGTFHGLDETLNDHPQGRCVAVPKTKTWAEMGYPDMPDNTIEIEDGESQFARLSADEQREILGEAAYQAYRSGAVRLTDFAGERVDPEWGRVRYRRSLREIAGARAA